MQSRQKEEGTTTIKEKKERNIADMLQRHDWEVHLVGETLSAPVRFHRVKVVTTFMKVGVPLNKLDYFRDLLEENAFSSSSSQQLRDYIPVILRKAMRRLRNKFAVGKCQWYLMALHM